MIDLSVKHRGSSCTIRSNGGRLYLSSESRTLRLKDLKTGNPVAVDDKAVFSATFADKCVARAVAESDKTGESLLE